MQEFENLIAWQKARELTSGIYFATRCGQFAKDCGLAGQIQRAAVSIMSNIAEGFERNNSTEFHRYLVMAKGSCAEVRSQLYVAMDAGYLPGNEFKRLMGQAKEVGKIIGGLRAAVEKRKKLEGSAAR